MSVRNQLLILSAVLALALAGRALAQNDGYTLVAWTVDGGGSTLSGGSYTLSATIGQPDAGLLEGGGYALYGGFWGGALSGKSQPLADGKVDIFLPQVHTSGGSRAATERSTPANAGSGDDQTPKNWLPVVTRP